MQKINFTKLQALGNDFILIDKTYQPEIELTTKLTQQLCDRKYGVGCDQLLVINKLNQPNHFNYTIYNNDGSIAGHCGNGARAVTLYIAKKYNLLDTIYLHTSSKRITSGIVITQEHIKIDMGLVSFTPDSLPANLEYNDKNNYTIEYNKQTINYAIASVGNPHIIIKCDHQEQFDDNNYIINLGDYIQQFTTLFPKSVNVNFYYPTSQNTILLKTYERGSGLTLACGTGATVSATYCNQFHDLAKEIIVTMIGGQLIITQENNSTYMTGTASIVFNGVITL